MRIFAIKSQQAHSLIIQVGGSPGDFFLNLGRICLYIFDDEVWCVLCVGVAYPACFQRGRTSEKKV